VREWGNQQAQTWYSKWITSLMSSVQK
jgi:hypothetical protein